MQRFNPFPNVNCRYGAPMGRTSTRTDLTDDMDLCVAGPAYEYDSGGAYWGLPNAHNGPVWAVWERSKGREGVTYVRAKNRDHAKRTACGETE